MNEISTVIDGVKYVAVTASGCTECAFFENCKDLCVSLELPYDMVFKRLDDYETLDSKR